MQSFGLLSPFTVTSDKSISTAYEAWKSLICNFCIICLFFSLFKKSQKVKRLFCFTICSGFHRFLLLMTSWVPEQHVFQCRLYSLHYRDFWCEPESQRFIVPFSQRAQISPHRFSFLFKDTLTEIIVSCYCDSAYSLCTRDSSILCSSAGGGWVLIPLDF